MTPIDTVPQAPARLEPLLVDTIRQLGATRQERDLYREIAIVAIHSLHELRVAHDRQADRYHALLDERRAERLQRAA